VNQEPNGVLENKSMINARRIYLDKIQDFILHLRELTLTSAEEHDFETILVALESTVLAHFARIAVDGDKTTEPILSDVSAKSLEPQVLVIDAIAEDVRKARHAVLQLEARIAPLFLRVYGIDVYNGNNNDECVLTQMKDNCDMICNSTANMRKMYDIASTGDKGVTDCQ